jgi:hypothetical protein
MWLVWARGLGSALTAWRSRAVAAVMLTATALLACWAGAAAAKSRAPVLSFSPSPYDYGAVTSGQTVSRTFRLTNSGGSAAAPLITVTGSSAFAVNPTRDTCSATVLRPGKACTVEVRFAPTNAGKASATLTAASKKPAATATDTLTGTEPTTAHLYWTDSLIGTIMEANLDGTDPHAIATGQQHPTGVAVAGNHLYWTNLGFGGFSDGTVVKANLDGSDPHTIADSQHLPAGVAVDSSHLYWINTRGAKEIDGGSLVQADLDGTHQQLLMNGTDGPYGLALNQTYLYVTFIGFPGPIERFSLPNPGDFGQTIAGENDLRGVAANGSHLYWATRRGGASKSGMIIEANLDGTDQKEIATGSDVEAPTGVAVDSGHLYWTNTPNTNGAAGSIVKANLDGTDQKVIVSNQREPLGVAVGD